MLITRARPVFFCVMDFGGQCNLKEEKEEETNFVKWVVKIVRWGSLFSAWFLLAPSAASLMLIPSFSVWSERTFNTVRYENWGVRVVLWINVSSLPEMNSILENPNFQYWLHRRII